MKRLLLLQMFHSEQETDMGHLQELCDIEPTNEIGVSRQFLASNW